MLKQPLVPLALALILVAVFAYGLARLFQLRFERGDVFPPYSSLRTDPTGTKALHDALSEMPGVTVTRNYKSLRQFLEADHDATILVLGVPEFESITQDDLRELMFLSAKGHRVVLTLRSKTSKPRIFEPSKGIDRETESNGNNSDGNMEEGFESDAEDSPSALNSFQVDIGYLNARESLRAVSAAPGLPAEIAWNSVLYFTTRDLKWRVIYRVDEGPVLMERRFGAGSMVLASDSFFLSNEALRDDRHPVLLAWLTGRHRFIVFDESHNGLSENENVMTLVRKYKLRPLGIALAWIAALFIWKTAFPFAPGISEGERESGVVEGKDSAAGFVNLLRRSVTPRELLATCVRHWKDDCKGRAKDWKDRVEAVNRVVLEIDKQPGRQRDPVEGYRKIARILARDSRL